MLFPDEIPSVPELRAHRDACAARLLRALRTSRGWRESILAYQKADQALQDAQWRLACDSWKWTRWPGESVDEHAWWWAGQLIAAARYNRVCGVGPSKALMVRHPEEVP